MTTTTPRPAENHSGEYSHRQVLTILGGLMLGMFLASLDQTIVSTAIRTIADDLNGLSIQAWVTTAYLIAATITTPIYGKLGDLYGRKKLFMFAISLFVTGSVLCTFSTSMYELAAFRAVQGLGAGGLMTLVLAIIGDIVSPRERAKYTGYFMATFATSSVLGPVIGGVLAGADSIAGVTGWRWVFLVNVPIGLLALVVVQRTLNVDSGAAVSKVRIDWWGAAALVVGLVPLLTVAEQGREWGWGSGLALTMYVVAVVGLIGFYLIERAMGAAALIPLSLFKLRAGAVTLSSSVVIGAAMFGALLSLPLYMQIVHGASPTESGFLMLPLVAGLMIGSISSGQIISRTGQVRIFPIVGASLMIVAMVLLATTSADTALPVVMVFMLIMGVGLGNTMQPLILTMQSSVPPQQIGVATSSVTFFRQMGGTLGTAVFLSVLFSTVTGNIGSELASAQSDPAFQQVVQHPVTPTDQQIVSSLQGGGSGGGAVASVTDDSSFIQNLSAPLAHPFKAGFADSMDIVFWMGAGVGILALLVLLLMPKVELRATSASAARQSVPAAPHD